MAGDPVKPRALTAEIVERVEPIVVDMIVRASAIAEGDREAAKNILTKGTRAIALELLDAIREPSEAMVEAGTIAISEAKNPWATAPRRFTAFDEARAGWRAMIDARKREIAG